MKQNEGIFHQMKNSKVLSGDKLSIKDLEELIKANQEEHYKSQKLRETETRDNLSHLNKRAKELGKEIPTEVLYTILSGEPVGSWFFDKYKEWL